jgi:pentatricopeptide repeat domain-containing protein 1
MTAGMALLRAMWARDVPRTVRTYNVAMALCNDCGAYLRAVGLLEVMRGEGLQPDVVSYNTALRACCDAEDDTRALSLLHEVSKSTST